MTAVAVLGLGAMGLPMAPHLASLEGVEVRGFDIAPARRELVSVERAPIRARESASIAMGEEAE